jgi:hypothetical protein
MVGVTGALPGQAASNVPNPIVTGPITGGIHGHPWNDQPFELADIGYTEREYFITGTAKTYTATPTTAAYTTRILVYHPANVADFNGTTIVEWDNVTAQAAFTPIWDWTHHFALANGYAFVFVSAQAAGVCCSPLSHQVWDPVRYLPLSHPGDDYSFDIYSQAIQAVRNPANIDPMDGLVTQRVLAVGQSQSAGRLKTYIEKVQDDAQVADGFLVDAGGGKTWAVEPPVPVIQLLSEDGLSPADPVFPSTLSTSPNYRLWEVPAGSHNDSTTPEHRSVFRDRGIDNPKHPYAEEEALHANGLKYGEEGPSPHLTCSPVFLKSGNEYPRRYVDDAAIYHLDRWMRGLGTPPVAPRAAFDSAGQIARDAYGNALGGIRLPPIDVPVATYRATVCALFGITVPLDPTTLAALYPTHDDYVTKMQAATDSAVAAGFLLPSDAAELMAKANASLIPSWPPLESPLS